MDFDLAQRRRRGKIILTKKTLSVQIKRSISLLIGTLVFLLVLFGIIYLLNTTQSSQKGYTLQQEQLKKGNLLLQDRNLVNEIIDAQSYNKIEGSTLVKEMIKPTEPKYIEP